MSISPKVITAHKQLLTSENNKSFFGLALIIKFILDKIDSNNDWLQLLDKVLSQFPNIKIQGMGFPENWKKILEDNI
jgi:abortive infection bacteriophage resistance protein